jgi:excisionase family DNA binding protein
MDMAKWMRMPQLARYLSVSRTTVYRLVQQHHLPTHKVAGTIFFDQEEVDRWIRSGVKKKADFTDGIPPAK